MSNIICKDELLIGRYSIIRQEVIRSPVLSPGAKLLYAEICSYFWKGEDDKAWPGQKHLAKMLSVHENSIASWMKELERTGVISQKRRGLGKTNEIYLHQPKPDRLNVTQNERGSWIPTRSEAEEQSGSSIPRVTKHAKTAPTNSDPVTEPQCAVVPEPQNKHKNEVLQHQSNVVIARVPERDTMFEKETLNNKHINNTSYYSEANVDDSLDTINSQVVTRPQSNMKYADDTIPSLIEKYRVMTRQKVDGRQLNGVALAMLAKIGVTTTAKSGKANFAIASKARKSKKFLEIVMQIYQMRKNGKLLGEGEADKYFYGMLKGHGKEKENG